MESSKAPPIQGAPALSLDASGGFKLVCSGALTPGAAEGSLARPRDAKPGQSAILSASRNSLPRRDLRSGWTLDRRESSRLVLRNQRNCSRSIELCGILLGSSIRSRIFSPRHGHPRPASKQAQTRLTHPATLSASPSAPPSRTPPGPAPEPSAPESFPPRESSLAAANPAPAEIARTLIPPA